MIINKVAGLVVLMLAWQPAFAYSLSDRSIEILFSESVAVVGAKTKSVEGSCNPDYCSFQYSLEVTSVDKGSFQKKDELKVCSDTALDLGLQYVVFLELGHNDLHGKSLCGYNIPRDGVFARFGHRVYRYGSPDASILIEYEGELYQARSVLIDNFDDNFNKIKNPK